MFYLLPGSTSQIDRGVLRKCLESLDITSVIILTHRDLSEAISKLTTYHIYQDFTSYPPDILEELAKVDTCISWWYGECDYSVSPWHKIIEYRVLGMSLIGHLLGVLAAKSTLEGNLHITIYHQLYCIITTSSSSDVTRYARSWLKVQNKYLGSGSHVIRYDI